MAYVFETIIASRGYHVYKETSWSNAKVGEDVKVELETNPKSIACDPYSCAIKAKHDYFVGWKTVGHIPREISRYVYFFIKQEGGKVYGRLKSLKYKASPIPSGGLEVPLLLKFKCDEKWVLDAMEEFVNNFYLYDFAGNLVDDKDEDDESEIEFDIAIEEGKEEEEEEDDEEEIGSSNNENEKEEEERLRKELLSDGQIPIFVSDDCESE